MSGACTGSRACTTAPRQPSSGCVGEAVHAEGAAVPGESSEAAEAAVEVSPLAALLTRHLIPPSETVVLLLKPSLCFIPLTSMMTLGFAALVALAGNLFDEQLPGHASAYLNAAFTVAALRLMWATLQWMGRYYILTDARVMAVSGVLRTTVQQCMLRRVARVRILRTFKDRLCLLGTAEVIPMDEEEPIVVWLAVGRPRDVKERLQRAVARAKGRL
ncbi:MAG: PH domain-containing protein [Tepidisphaerales bacterium]